MKKLMGKEAVDALAGVLPYIRDTLPEDAAIIVTDTVNYIAVEHGRMLETGIKEGMELPKYSSAYESFMTKKITQAVVPEERYGTSFLVINVPIFDPEGNVVGTLSSALGRSKEKTLNEISNQLNDGLNQMTYTIQEIATSADRLASIGQNLLELADLSTKNISETETILNLIKRVSDQTNLLGLNAAIEAARAGEHGMGFRVVAGEIRKLAENSKSATEQVNQIVSSISEAVSGMVHAIEESGAISQEQAATTEETSVAIKHLTEIAKKLDTFAKSTWSK